MAPRISSIDINGGKMDYFSFGSGETPFVMLPGIYTKPMVTLAGLVECAYQMFSERFTVFVPDRCAPIPDGYTIDDLADDTIGLLDSLGITNACVFGVSMGGMTAQTIAVKRPDLVQRLVLASTASRIGSEAAEQFKAFLELAASGDIKAMCTEFAKAVYTPSFFERFKNPILRSFDGSTCEDIDRFAALTRGILKFDIHGKLGSIHCPALVIAGSEDAVFSTRYSEDIAEKTGAELCIYEGYGHAVYDEAPDIKDKLFEFFTKATV